MMRTRQAMAVAASIGALATFAVAGYQLVGGGDTVNVTTAEVTSGDIVRRVMVTGTLQPARTVEIGSQVSGTIQSIDADFNDAVKRGQIVAHLDPSIYEARLVEASARVAQLAAAYESARAVADDAQTKLARAEQLAAAEVIPVSELDAARVASQQTASVLKATAADIAAAQAVAAEARVSLNYTTIRSPIDGIVIARHVDVGQTVQASAQTPVLFTVADTRRMQLLAEIAESDVAAVSPGSKAVFQIESIGNHSFEGIVSSVRLQPFLQQVARPAAGGPSASAPQSVTLTPMPAPGSSAPSSTAASPGPIGTAGASAPSAGQPTPAGTTPTSNSVTQSPASAAASGRAESSTPASSAAAVPSAAGAVVTYIAVIDVDNANGDVPPGGSALVFLPGEERQNVVRVPNSALTFRPSPPAFAAVGQDPPTLDSPRVEADQERRGVRLGHVWKFENRRFIPIPVDVGVADDSWTQLVSGPIQPGDLVVTEAVPGVEPTR